MTIQESPFETWFEIEERRSQCLRGTDWIVLREREEIENGLERSLTVDEYFQWLEYRQALRDLPQKYTNPKDVVFPMMPKLRKKDAPRS